MPIYSSIYDKSTKDYSVSKILYSLMFSVRAALLWLGQDRLGTPQGDESPLWDVDSEALLGKVASPQTLWFARQEAFWITGSREYCQCQCSQRESPDNFVLIYSI